MKRKEASQGAAAKRSSRLRFSKDETEAAGASASDSGSGNENSAKSEPSDQSRANPNSSATGKDSPQGSKKVQRLEKKSETKHAKLEKAQDKLPTKRKIKLKYRDESTLKVRHKLHFEQEVKSRSEHVKGSMPKRAVKGVSNLGIAHAHKKLYQAEDENVGTKAAHRSELVAETGLRSALRFHKTAPYRKVEKLEHSVQKADIKLAYNKALEENPQLKSNMFSRMAQKHKIKKDYAQAAREAKKTGSRAKSVATKAKQTGTKALMGTIFPPGISIRCKQLVAAGTGEGIHSPLVDLFRMHFPPHTPAFVTAKNTLLLSGFLNHRFSAFTAYRTGINGGRYLNCLTIQPVSAAETFDRIFGYS